MEFLGIIGLGIVVFASTNIDDIFVLMMFFADRNFSPRQIVIGQYLGIGLLVAISAVGALVALVVPPTVVGLMGFLPIAIGVKKLWDARKSPAEDQSQMATEISGAKNYLRLFTVTAVTFSNGGDNIGVYIPLFANSTLSEMVGLIFIFAVMTTLWCAIAYYLVNRSFVGKYIQRIGSVILPFVLIGLGLYILAEAFLLPN